MFSHAAANLKTCNDWRPIHNKSFLRLLLTTISQNTVLQITRFRFAKYRKSCKKNTLFRSRIISMRNFRIKYTKRVPLINASRNCLRKQNWLSKWRISRCQSDISDGITNYTFFELFFLPVKHTLSTAFRITFLYLSFKLETKSRSRCHCVDL